MLKKIKEIDYLISLSKTNKEITVFRGIQLFHNGSKFTNSILNLQEGDIFLDNGYCSSSYSPSHALSYALDGEVITMMEIKIPKGYNAIPLLYNKSAYFDGEFEVLLHRNSKLKVKRILATKTVFNGKEKYILHLSMEAIE